MDNGRDKQPRGPGKSGVPTGSRSAKPTSSAKPASSVKLAKDAKPQQSVPPGEIAADNRGRNVWHFHGESIDSTSMMLQRLDNPSLALEPTRKVRKLEPGAAPARGAPHGRSGERRPSEAGGTSQSFEQRYQIKPGKNPGGGFDPYNKS